jgi:cell division protein FtsI/penicillin-binding protein 2
MVTPLQLARGMCAYANGGHLLQPRLVKGVLDENGGVVSSTKPRALKDTPIVIDPIIVAQMKRILADVPIRGTATKARSKTWNIFGKTGTAHISRNGSYSDSAFNSSFIGGAPFENPRLVVAMVLHEPDPSKGHFGGAVSAPAACKTLERSLAYLQTPASPDLAPPPPQIASVLWGYDEKLYSNRSASARE